MKPNKAESKMIIEKNIPIPAMAKNRRASKYPFLEMKVGDSVYFTDQPEGSQSLPVMAARMTGRTQNPRWKFTVRALDGGVRIWRTE